MRVLNDFPHMILNNRVQDKMPCLGHITFFIGQCPMSGGYFDPCP